MKLLKFLYKDLIQYDDLRFRKIKLLICFFILIFSFFTIGYRTVSLAGINKENSNIAFKEMKLGVYEKKVRGNIYSRNKKLLATTISVTNLNINPQKISAPGQSRIHYSPGIPIRLNVKKIKKNEALLLIKKNKNKKTNYYFLSKKGNLKEAAKNLYPILRKIKKDNYKSIAVGKIPNKGFGKTINDRLLRASKF